MVGLIPHGQPHSQSQHHKLTSRERGGGDGDAAQSVAHPREGEGHHVQWLILKGAVRFCG